MTLYLVWLVAGIIIGIVIGILWIKLSQSGKFVAKLEFDKLLTENNQLKIDSAKLYSQEYIESKYVINGIYDDLRNNYNKKGEEIEQQATTIREKDSEISTHKIAYQKLKSENETLLKRQEQYDEELKKLQDMMALQFEKLANKILEEKSEKFTKQNLDNINTILKPLGENLDTFKKKVEEVYDKESKERFSLGKEVEKLVILNQRISDEANNLTNALKGNSKTQGDWGEMILENILEKSGLVRDREYFVQEYLKDEDGNPLKNTEGKMMRPDVIISYPDNRKVIVDSKVSLTAYSRFIATDLKEEQIKAIDDHIKSIKKHVEELSNANYQDFAPSLDFVMLFIPNEPAFMIAMQHEKDLWHYAYNKRVILISPTNLITALKLVSDLWKREYQNRNAQEIADRGAALYEKFVGFVDNLTDIGENIKKSQKSYDAALGQLKDGRGNLISQAEKLKELGVKPKKNIPVSLVNESLLILDEETTKDA
jgi:DNA recombination protein RmuC